jgi:ketosteroid isomerase-like protein
MSSGVVKNCTAILNKKMENFNLETVKQIIEVNHQAYSENFAKGDASQFAKHYTSDACIFPTNFPKMCGTDAINTFFDGAYKMGVRNIKLTSNEVMGGPELVVESGVVELFIDNNIAIYKGKFIIIWKQENDQWKMYRDIWNIDTPAENQN